MITKIQGEAPFQVLATNFSISPSQQDYTLQISANGTDFSDLFTVSAGQTKMVTSVASGSYYRLKNNQSNVEINWRTQCSDGQGGGGGGQGPQGPAGPQGPQGPAGAGDPSAIQQAIDANNTLIEEGEIIAGMAKQLYSPDGVTSEGTFAYRTTGGDNDVFSGPAKLQKIEGNATFPETEYNDSVVLMRDGSEVEGFDADIEWGDVTEWVELSGTTAETISLLVKQGRVKITQSYGGNPKINFGVYPLSNPSKQVSISFKYTVTGYTEYTNKCTLVSDGVWTFNDGYSGAQGGVVFDGEWLTITFTDNDCVLYNLSFTADAGYTAPDGVKEIKTGTNIPNDIPLGESDYSYDGSDWSVTLPQAITSMTINGVDYVPQSGDELVVTRSMYKEGSATYPVLDSFVALGLNSFTKDSNDIINFTASENAKISVTTAYPEDYNITQNSDYNVYMVKAVTGLEDGYVVYHKEGSSVSLAGVADNPSWEEDLQFSGTIHTTNYDVVFPTEEFPYIVFSLRKDDEGTVCVHPRWSGYQNENYEDYTESILVINEFNNDCPLVSVGNVKNIWDFENSQLIENISRSDYSAEAVEDLINGGKEIGVDFDFDENNIYEVLDEPNVIDIEFDNNYIANDFSVEYFLDENAELSTTIATTWYMNNLVDKLRRMNGLVHLDNLDGVGNENTLYEADGYLWYWSVGSGSVAEWTNRPDENGFGSTRGYSLIFSHIPDGQTIFEAKYQYDNDSEYKAFKMSGGTLVMTNSANTVLSACTVGNSAEMRVRNNSSNYVVRVYVNKHMIGFDMVGLLSFRNVWDGNVSGGHFCITDHYKYPYLYGVTTDSGIPRWNNKGQIVGKDSSYSTRNIYFNTTGSSSSNRISVLTNGNNNGPDHLFVPSQSGTQGQILQSNGNAEPTWIDWIKVVKITSDAYDALATKDPNTLYLIDDE